MFDHVVLPSGVRVIRFVEGKPIEAVTSSGERRPLDENEKGQLILLMQHAKAKIEEYTHFEQTGERNHELFETGRNTGRSLPPGASKTQKIEKYFEQIRDYNNKHATQTQRPSAFRQSLKRLPFLRRT